MPSNPGHPSRSKLADSAFNWLLPAVVVLPGIAAPTVVARQPAPQTGMSVGEVFPDFHLPLLNGDLKKLSDFRGKKILLFNFASW
ncbi:MAG: peroxiredoxin family protein [Planctomycetota bacterium]|jgi:hypothetical protein